MAANDAKVRSILDGELKAVNANPKVATVTDALEAAWTSVNSKRNAGIDCSEDMASAEHYLYLRYLLSKYGPILMSIVDAASDFYGLLKLLHIT